MHRITFSWEMINLNEIIQDSILKNVMNNEQEDQ